MVAATHHKRFSDFPPFNIVSFTTRETELDYYYQKLHAGVASRADELLKTPKQKHRQLR